MESKAIVGEAYREVTKVGDVRIEMFNVCVTLCGTDGLDGFTYWLSRLDRDTLYGLGRVVDVQWDEVSGSIGVPVDVHLAPVKARQTREGLLNLAWRLPGELAKRAVSLVRG